MYDFLRLIAFFFTIHVVSGKSSIAGFDKIKDDIVIKIPGPRFVFSWPVDLSCVLKIVKGRRVLFVVFNRANVFSMNDGEVLLSDCDSGLVIILNKDVNVIYSDLEKINVEEGSHVKKGALIGVASEKFYVQVRINNIIVDFLKSNYFTAREWRFLEKFLKE